MNYTTLLLLLICSLDLKTIQAMDIQDADEVPILLVDHVHYTKKQIAGDCRQQTFNSSLHDSLRFNDLDGCKEWLQKGADANYHNSTGFALIHTAICSGDQPKIVNLLLEHGASLSKEIIRTTVESQGRKVDHTWICTYGTMHYIPLGSTPFHMLDYSCSREKKERNILLYHALFYGVGQRKFTKESFTTVTLAPKDFVAMLTALHAPTRETSRHALGERIALLKKILLIKNKIGEVQKTIAVDALDSDLPPFFAALEAGTIKKLDKTNLYKGAYDAMDEHGPSNCVIC